MGDELIIGIDPSNTATGIAFWRDGECIASGVLNPWKNVPPWVDHEGPVNVYVEVPQNGTHKSRGGVHWAAGMVMGHLAERFFIPRSRVRKITPSTWREKVLGDAKATKQDAVKAAETYLPPARRKGLTHDEAEAILIGAYGVLDRGGEIR